MSEYICEVIGDEVAFKRAGTSEIETVKFDASDVERQEDFLQAKIDETFDRIERWEELKDVERQRYLLPLAKAGRSLLLAMDIEPNAEALREILEDVSKLSVGSRSRTPWEFLYLGDIEEPIEIGKFLGSRIVVGRWFASRKTTRRSGSPARGKELSLTTFYKIPENDYQVLLAEDLELSSAKSGREKRVLEKYADEVFELIPLANGAEDDAQILRQNLSKSEALSHFNCHGLPAGRKGRQNGLIYITEKYEVGFPFAASISLAPHSIVVLNTCFGADLSPHRSRCIAAAFASSPGVTVVASYHKVEDGFASSWADAFYEALFAGNSVSDAMIFAKQRIIQTEQNPAILLYTIVGQFGAKLLPSAGNLVGRSAAA